MYILTKQVIIEKKKIQPTQRGFFAVIVLPQVRSGHNRVYSCYKVNVIR